MGLAQACPNLIPVRARSHWMSVHRLNRPIGPHIQFPATYSVSAPGAVRMAAIYGEYSSSYTLTKNVLDAERHLVSEG